MSASEVRDRLKSVKNPKPQLAIFNTDTAPDEPIELATQWLLDAIDSGAVEPNSVTLSTASSAGEPSARTLLLKDITPEGFWFASLSSSRKGADLAENPRGAITMYWREVGRQVRVSGRVVAAAREVSEQDFLARHPLARAQAIAGRQSEPMPGDDTARDLLDAANDLVAKEPGYVPDDWNAYLLVPELVDFWQAVAGHDQLRLQYRLHDGVWVAERVWP